MLPGKKTYVAVIVGLVAVAGAFYLGEINVVDAINQVIVLLGIGGVRLGVAGK